MTPDVRVTERVEWRNVYLDENGVRVSSFWHITRAQADESARYSPSGRVAVERVTITERVERFPVPEETGQ